MSEIENVASERQNYCFTPDRSFTQNRKLPMEKVLKGINGMKNGSLTNEVLDFFDASATAPTSSAFEFLKEKNHYRRRPSSSVFDYLPIKGKKSDPAIFFEFNLRMVRFQISEDTYETVITNLNKNMYPDAKLKELYSARWRIETSFRNLKYSIDLLDFHSKKAMCIRQEIYARLIMYNFAEMITSYVVIEKKQRKYIYKANFSVAVQMCRLFYQGKKSSHDLETIIAKNLIPIRPGRYRDRNLEVMIFHGFLYRAA